MSVAQVKKTIAEMAEYLGRDSHGQDKLRRIKDAVNILRNKLSACTESEASAAARLKIATDEAARLRDELTASQTDIHSLRQRVNNLTADVNRLTATATTDDNQSPAASDDRACYKSAIKELRTLMSRCPRAISHRSRASTTGLIFTRESISKGWSHRALWMLGASVAILSAYKGEVTIISGDTISELEPYDDDDMTKKCHQFLRWFANNIDWSPDDAISAAARDTKVDMQKTKGYLYK